MTNKQLIEEALQILGMIDGYRAADLERVFRVMDLLKQLQIEENPVEAMLEQTQSEIGLLARFDDEFFALCQRYAEEPGLRREILDAAVLANAEAWQDYYEEQGDDDE